MGNSCTIGCDRDDLGNESNEATVDLTRLDLGSIQIIDFERRVKKFAHPINRGRVTVDQLYEAFIDTEIFS